MGDVQHRRLALQQVCKSVGKALRPAASSSSNDEAKDVTTIDDDEADHDASEPTKLTVKELASALGIDEAVAGIMLGGAPVEDMRAHAAAQPAPKARNCRRGERPDRLCRCFQVGW